MDYKHLKARKLVAEAYDRGLLYHKKRGDIISVLYVKPEIQEALAEFGVTFTHNPSGDDIVNKETLAKAMDMDIRRTDANLKDPATEIPQTPEKKPRGLSLIGDFGKPGGRSL